MRALFVSMAFMTALCLGPSVDTARASEMAAPAIAATAATVTAPVALLALAAQPGAAARQAVGERQAARAGYFAGRRAAFGAIIVALLIGILVATLRNRRRT